MRLLYLLGVVLVALMAAVPSQASLGYRPRPNYRPRPIYRPGK
uniref:Astacidin 2 n=1 Tax=Pacifastacus leniusculus TaxID=6720 RepID=Q0PJU7_PACLE|nr:astacidin 2 [Pacifastacus leniusculus]